MLNYTSLFLFCGLGSGARGFLQARARLFGQEARFVSLGGIDNDPAACADFEYLTKSPALCADIAALTPGKLRAFAGERAPDAAFGSAPCKSFSGLTNPELAATVKYVDMARLYVTGVELLLSTWDVPPRLIILENVPRILSSGAHLVAEVMGMLEAAGYAVDISTHDCGEIGGLAQRRRRALLLGRLKRSVTAPVMRPPIRKVRPCGDVLGTLPMPEDPRAGSMHRMPRIGWLTWLRLAMIPAGGDYRDLPGALDGLQKKREAWARMHVESFDNPSVAVTSGGTNGTYGVADPRIAAPTSSAYQNNHAIGRWEAPARTVIGATRPGSGAACVADPRVAFNLGDAARTNICAVQPWEKPSRAVAGGTRPAGGGVSIADPRAADRWFPGTLGVVPWSEPFGTVTGKASPTRGAFTVADVRLGERKGRKVDHCYGVLPWTSPSFTVHGTVHPGTGAYTVADPRIPLRGMASGNEGDRGGDASKNGPFGSAGFGTLSLAEASKTITPDGHVARGPFAIVRPDGVPVAFIDNPKNSPFVMIGKKRVSVPIVIVAEDGTWHRPLTPLELARLQDLPATVDGNPLQLFGSNVGDIVERVGNAVPVGTAEAIAEEKLLCLLSSDIGAGMSPSGGKVWVSPWADADADAMH